MSYLFAHVQLLILSDKTVTLGRSPQLSLAITAPVLGDGTSPAQLTVSSVGIDCIVGSV